MATPFSDVFDAFLARIEDLDWALEEDAEIVNRDLTEILKMAIFEFRFPHISLEVDTPEDGGSASSFVETLGNSEIQVLAILMKLQWLRRQKDTWRLIKQQYTDKDFVLSSQANHLAQIINSLESTEKEVKRAISTYSRCIDGKSYPYSNWVGGI